MAASRARLDGDRWHFSHGPIDIVIGADGDTAAVTAAHQAAWQRFQPLLDELVAELSRLRAAVAAGDNPLRGEVARCMWAACAAHRPLFITPMAAVAGAVAQALIGCYARPGVRRAWVNNGGDIALHLAAGESLRIGLVADLGRFDDAALRQAAAGRVAPDGRLTVHAGDGIAGVATSGWRGRSFSLGIADSVTVLAATAAQADAAATVVANAVNVEHPLVQRAPAHQLRDDTDLGDRRVIVSVPPLPPQEVAAALQNGTAVAHQLCQRGLIAAAALVCQGQVQLVSSPTTVPALPEFAHAA